MAEHFHNELERALSRDDATQLKAAVQAYHRDWEGASPDSSTDSEHEWLWHVPDHPEKALAFVVLAASISNSPEFLLYVAAGPLEELLRCPSEQVVERIIAEARKSPRFRWMLGGVFPHAVAGHAWRTIAPLLADASRDAPMPPAPWT